MYSMFCIRCYLNVIALYAALELDVMIEHFRLTQAAGILSRPTDFFLKISFNLRYKSSLQVLCVYTFFTFLILHCINCVLSLGN